MPRQALAGLIVLLALLPGCMEAVPEAGLPPETVANAPWPRVDARETLDALRTFSEAFPYRQSGTPTHLASRDSLAGALEDAGLDVVRQRFPGDAFGVGAPYDGENVVGIKWGADRARWVVVGSHYDITEGAVHGAYDDGSGTLMVVKLAEAFAKLDTNRTIAFVFFDQEERGLVGSRYFLDTVQAGAFEHPATIDAMIDLDMIGITWPHPAPLVVWENSPSLKNATEAARVAVGVPDANVEYRQPTAGTSDGAVFIRAGIATAYYMSQWDETHLPDGTATPASYPFWHQADTYESMVLMAGGEATLEAGFQTVLDVVSPVLAHAASSAFEPDGYAPDS